MMRSDVRNAVAADITPLARLWHDGWQDAHHGILPEVLAKVRTYEHFLERLEIAGGQLRVVGKEGDPLGFSLCEGDELNQFYVDARARGSGLAQMLIEDAEARLAEQAVVTAWLACAIGNERAARFYEKCGWHRAGIYTSKLPLPDGVFALDVWRYEKRLALSPSTDSANVNPHQRQ